MAQTRSEWLAGQRFLDEIMKRLVKVYKQNDGIYTTVKDDLPLMDIFYVTENAVMVKGYVDGGQRVFSVINGNGQVLDWKKPFDKEEKYGHCRQKWQEPEKSRLVRELKQ